MHTLNGIWCLSIYGSVIMSWFIGIEGGGWKSMDLVIVSEHKYNQGAIGIPISKKDKYNGEIANNDNCISV